LIQNCDSFKEINWGVLSSTFENLPTVSAWFGFVLCRKLNNESEKKQKNNKLPVGMTFEPLSNGSTFIFGFFGFIHGQKKIMQ